MCIGYVSIQQTIRYSICKISDIACGPPFWTVLVSWYPHKEGTYSPQLYCKYAPHSAWQVVSQYQYIQLGQHVVSNITVSSTCTSKYREAQIAVFHHLHVYPRSNPTADCKCLPKMMEQVYHLSTQLP